jgi:hypothetical protein
MRQLRRHTEAAITAATVLKRLTSSPEERSALAAGLLLATLTLLMYANIDI